jgi:DNA-binding winged helix-turn-helix (wHTH) protein
VYETLKFFVANPGRLVVKEELMQAVWPDSFVTDDSLVQCTLELRRALGDRHQQLLKTVPRRGYVFAAEVIQLQKKADPYPISICSDFSDGRGLVSAKVARKGRDPHIPRTSLTTNDRISRKD